MLARAELPFDRNPVRPDQLAKIVRAAQGRKVQRKLLLIDREAAELAEFCFTQHSRDRQRASAAARLCDFECFRRSA